MKILFIYKRELKVDEDTNVDLLRHPKKIMDRLSKVEVEGLLEKCEIYRKIEKVEDFQKFWSHLKSLATAHQERLAKYEQRKRGNFNIHSALTEDYNEDVESLLKGKSSKQLEDLEEQAQKFLSSTDLNVDVEFWDQVLSRVQVQKAVMDMEALHVKCFEGKGFEEDPAAVFTTKDHKTSSQPQPLMMEPPRADPLSPRAYTGSSFGSSIKTVTAADYKKRLNSLREKSYKKELALLVKEAEKELEIRKTKEHLLDQEEQEASEEELNLDEETKKFREILASDDNKPEEDELAFDDFEGEVQKTSDWIDKFKPRKPHYFNRVKMGYEWNKVNQAHYDLDTPPPKQVLGYKFNIFYPNLINKSQIPSYELIQTDQAEFCIIKFTAGPPYEDLSFKIVHREWDLSDRQGFKCIFDRGMLHLHFNFKMVRYRR